MSKEIQIREGNLIASFDLENEDGDIDFCKLLKVSRGVADEIGMFVDYVATNKIIKDQSKKISDLETKLADKDKAIENWETMYKSVVQTCHNDKEEIERLNKQLAEKDKEITQRLVIQERDYNQDKISFALEQLEKVKEYIKTNLMSFQKVPIIQEIDNQIKQLKEMK